MKLRDGHRWFGIVAGGVLCASLGCGTSVESVSGGTGGAGGGNSGSGGSPGSGGAAPGSGGSASGTGGAQSGSGGVSAVGTGGRVASTGGSGVVATGGTTGGSTTLTPILTLPWMDDFEGDTAGGEIKGWIRAGDVDGKWAVATEGGSKVLQETVATDSISLIAGGDIAWTDQKVEVKVKFATVTTSSIAYLMVRLVDVKNYYFLEFKGDGSMKVRKEIMDSTNDVLSYKTKMDLVAGTTYTVGVGFKGNVVTAYLNGAAVGTMTENPASLSHGGIALGFKGATGSFDDVKVTLP